MSIDFDKLKDFARYYGVLISITYWEADDQYSIEVISAAKGEHYYKKRVISSDSFIKSWENKIITTDIERFSDKYGH